MIDHIFMLIETDGPEIEQFAAIGLTETYRRTHAGQGTQNICYCFDNLYLELLWVNDSDAVRSDIIRRTRLYERSLWRTNMTCPFGFAWRRSASDPAPPIPTWSFQPPYLPAGITIPIAIDSDDPRQPLLFESPGSTAPADWPIERRGSLQHSAGLGAVTSIRLTMPSDTPPSDALLTLAETAEPPLRIDQAMTYRLELRVRSLVNEPNLHISLPLA